MGIPPSSPSNVDMIRWLYAFNDWTRPQLIRAIARISDEQMRQPGLIVGGIEDGSIFSAIVHIVDVEESWLARWMGTPEDPAPDPVKYATLESTATQWEIVNQTRDAWLATLTADDLNVISRVYTGSDGVVSNMLLWPVLFHIPNHTAHHRSEIYEALTKLGFPPEEEPDVIDCLRDQLGVIPPYTVVAMPPGNLD
ncbi:MAG: DinB family protein [Thermomicrobiales bacterium]